MIKRFKELSKCKKTFVIIAFALLLHTVVSAAIAIISIFGSNANTGWPFYVSVISVGLLLALFGLLRLAFSGGKKTLPIIAPAISPFGDPRYISDGERFILIKFKQPLNGELFAFINDRFRGAAKIDESGGAVIDYHYRISAYPNDKDIEDIIERCAGTAPLTAQ